MGVWEIIIGMLVLLLSVVMIIVIILQEGHDAGLGTITGGADSFMKRGKAKTADALFAKVTKIVAIGFFVLVVVLNAISYFGGKNSSGSSTSIITGESSVAQDDTSAEESTQASEGSATESSEASATESGVTSTTESSATSTTESSVTSATESSAAVTSDADTSSGETTE